VSEPVHASGPNGASVRKPTSEAASPEHARSTSVSALFDSSPVIAELLRQISLSKSVALDLRSQVADAEKTGADSRRTLQEDLDAHRERKRGEDAARAELRTRTKALEDTKRSAEAGRREAEKRLRAARGQCDSASARMGRLDAEIARLRARMDGDREQERRGREEADERERELGEQVEAKRKEIKVAEDVVAALNARARELEEKIAQEKERLQAAKEHAEMLRQDMSFVPMHADVVWEPVPLPELELSSGDRASSSDDSSLDARPRKLSLGALSNFEHEPARARFAPFGDGTSGLLAPPFDPLGTGQISPMSSSLLPGGLIQSIALDGDAFVRSDEDPILEPRRKQSAGADLHISPPTEWTVPAEANGLTTSPASITGSEEDAFRVRERPELRHRVTSVDRIDAQRATLPRMPSNPSYPTFASLVDEDLVPVAAAVAADDRTAPRRWFASPWNLKDGGAAKDKDKPKKGLNPDAKVFSFPKFKAPLVAPGAPATSFAPGGMYDMLNPSSLSLGTSSRAGTGTGSGSAGSASIADGLLPTFSMRAFAPSPAEREALQRALGVGSNASLERLPSLATVGSLPNSPPREHAQTASLGGLGSSRSWLQSLPLLSRKPKFSPWDDEDAEDTKKDGASM
jgi:hypothetical protein